MRRIIERWNAFRDRGRRRRLCQGTGLLVLLGMAVVALGSCANPTAPSGGPRDRTPPSIERTEPVRDTVNVSADRQTVYVEFSEYVDRNSLSDALSITPQFDQRLRFSWSGQGVSIELPTSLRDSITYLFTFDTNLSDAHGVSLDEPIRVAFSTGSRIDRGQIRGRVVGPQEAEPRAQVDVFAYGLSDGSSVPPTPLPEQPDYRTQTGEDGTFRFDYLREQRYYVVAVRDNNRNRHPDPSEAFAVPPRPSLLADPDSSELPVPWLLTQADTTAPQLQQVQPVSEQRLRLSFSEPIRITSRTPDDWALRDSTTETPVEVRNLYRPAGRADAVVLRTAPMDSTRHTLPILSDLVADTLGQAVASDTARFHAVGRADTTQTRFRAFVPEELSPDSAETYPLLPDVQPGVRFNQAPDSSTLRSVLALEDTTGEARSYSVSTEDGRTYRLEGQPSLEPGEMLDVVVDGGALAGPDTTYRRRFRRVTDRVLGGLEGRVVIADTTYETQSSSETTSSDSVAAVDTIAADSAGSVPSDTMSVNAPIVVEIIPTQSSIPLERRQQTVEPGSTFVFEDLPEGTFRFRAFLDRNQNGRWDGGRIDPVERAEPVTWSEQTTDSRPRWTNVLPASLRIPVLRRPSDSASGPVPAPDTAATDSSEEDGP